VADRTIYTNEAALAEAADVKDALALSLLRLFNNTLVPTSTTTKADLVAAETALVGYPAGGYPITAFTGPLLASGGGALITSPLIAVAYASGASASIGGGWIEDAGGAVRAVFIFDPARTLSVVGDGFEFIRQLLYGRNSS
jgi:hypothetical protein